MTTTQHCDHVLRPLSPMDVFPPYAASDDFPTNLPVFSLSHRCFGQLANCTQQLPSAPSTNNGFTPLESPARSTATPTCVCQQLWWQALAPLREAKQMAPTPKARWTTLPGSDRGTTTQNRGSVGGRTLSRGAKETGCTTYPPPPPSLI